MISPNGAGSSRLGDGAATGLELRHLRALQAIARAGSFHAAAGRLGYTQSAISQQMASLERTLNQRLVERSGGRQGVTLTEPGERLLSHAEAIFARLDVAMRELGALGDGKSGSVRVGYFQSVGKYLLPTLIRQVSRRSRGIELHLTECECDLELQRRVIWGELDLAFVVLPLTEEGLTSVALLDDRPVAVVRQDDRIACGDHVALAELVERDLATFGTSPFQAALEEALTADGAHPRVVVRTQDNEALLALAASGEATALMTELSARGAAALGLRALPVAGAPSRRIALAWHAQGSQSRAMAAVVEEALAVSADAAADQARLSTMPIAT